MAQISITIQNLNTFATDTFTFPMEKEEYTAKWAALLPKHEDYEVVDIEIESDMHPNIEKVIKNCSLMRPARFSYMEKLIDIMEDLEDHTSSRSRIVDLWNDYCEGCNYMDDYVYTFDKYTLEEHFQNAYDAVRACLYGNVHPNHEYFQYNGYGNIVTSDYPAEDFMDVESMIEWFIEESL